MVTPSRSDSTSSGRSIPTSEQGRAPGRVTVLVSARDAMITMVMLEKGRLDGQYRRRPLGCEDRP